MKRMQIQLGHATFDSVRRRAFEERISLSRVVREAVERYVRTADPVKPSAGAPDGFGFVGIGRSRARKGAEPVSVDHDAAWAETVYRQHGHRRR